VTQTNSVETLNAFKLTSLDY